MRRRRPFIRFGKSERGAALVEFTLVLPFLMLLAAGVSEFGLIMHQQQIMTKSVRDAARYAARSPVAFKSCPINAQPEWGQIAADTQTVALRGSVNAGAPLLLATWNSAGQVTVNGGVCVAAGALNSPAGGGNNIPIITVTGTAPYAGTGLLNFLGIAPFNITATHTQMWTGL